MHNIKYKTIELFPKVFIFIVPNDYIRAMLFLRIQEFYESKNRKFRGKKFSFWDYKEWYSSLKGGKFTYAADWSGFNVPLSVALKCKKISKVETPYDIEMNKALDKICKKTNSKGSYLIGVKSIRSNTFKHELAHAFYYTNENYKKNMDEITKSIKYEKFKVLESKLKEIGYCKKVIMDEIQAYLSTERVNVLTKFVDIGEKIRRKYTNIFKEQYIRLYI